MPVRTRLLLVRRCSCVLGTVLLMMMALNLGCDEEEAPALTRAEQRAAELARQLEHERQVHERDRLLADTVQVEAREDHTALAIVLVSAAVTLVLLVLLLARERRARRVLERLLRMLLDRLSGRHTPS